MKIPALYLAFLLLASSVAWAQEYDIVFHRITKAGEKLVSEIKYCSESENQFTVNGHAQPSSKKTLEVDLKALSTEIAVDQDGNSQEAKLLITSCTCSMNGKDTPLFSPKDEILVKEGNPKTFMVNGSPASGKQLAVLTEMLPSRYGHAADIEDQVYGPGRRVKVGDSWPIRPADALADLAKKGMSLPKDAMQGTAQLESSHPVGGMPCLQIRAEMSIRATNVALPGAPEGLKASKYEITSKITNDLPVDKDVGRLSQGMENHVEIEGKGTIQQDGQSIDLAVHTVSFQKMDFRGIPAP